MLEKRGPRKDTENGALQVLRDKVKAGLLEFQFQSTYW